MSNSEIGSQFVCVHFERPNSVNLIKMFQIKFMLFAIVALMSISTTFGIIGGKDATRGQFPYYAYLESYKLAEKSVIIIEILV